MTNGLIWLSQHWGIAFYGCLVLASVSMIIASVIILWQARLRERRRQEIAQYMQVITTRLTPRAAGLKHRRVG